MMRLPGYVPGALKTRMAVRLKDAFSHGSMNTLNELTVCGDNERRADVIRRQVKERSQTNQKGEKDDAFYVMDVGYFVKAVMEWKRLLPRVYPYYAVKANPDPVLLQMMTKLNFGFDCASMQEIEAVTEMGNPPSRIIYSNTRKQPSYLKYAASVGVQYTTFDDKDELDKIKANTPNMRLLLRISTKNFTTSLSAGMTKKFGCHREETFNLLSAAKELGLTVNGVSFHVGSGCRDPNAYSKAIRETKKIFQCGEDLGFNMNIVDIGGGFSGETTNNYGVMEFAAVADVINRSLEEYFFEEADKEKAVQFIAEPGAYFAMPSTDLVTNIIGTRTNTVRDSLDFHKDSPEMEYFINDGNQSSLFLCSVVPELILHVEPVSEDDLCKPTFICKIWGQTCDEDVVIEKCRLPKLKTGDWLRFTDMGSYSAVYCTNFNGFPKRQIYRYISKTMLTCFRELVTEGAFLQLHDHLGYDNQDCGCNSSTSQHNE